jgi:hypothetical protein
MGASMPMSFLVSSGAPSSQPIVRKKGTFFGPEGGFMWLAFCCTEQPEANFSSLFHFGNMNPEFKISTKMCFL